MTDGVVWLPTNSAGSPVRAALGVDAGALVTLSPGRSPGRSPEPDPSGGATAADDVREN
jgi:NADH-quinone oxidoreductase subunit G